MKPDKGFTLLEILIVVVIIGILAGLGIPKFYKSIETAKGKEAYVMLETIRTAERMYYLDYGDYTSSVAPGNNFPSSLVPGYLPEQPNAKPLEDRNWSYGFYTPSGEERVVARREGGSHNWDQIQMYMNGDFYPNTNWPWPPD